MLKIPAPYDQPAATPAAPVQPHEPAAGGSYRRNVDGTLTCTQRTEPGAHDGRRRAPRPDEPAAPDPQTDAHQE